MTAPSDLVAMPSVIDSGARTQEDILTGPPHPTPHGRSFGGQVVGQAIAAGGTTVPEDRHIHSMHGYFLRPGSSSERMTFEVARLHDGRSFSTRRVQAYQNGTVLMSMIASFQGIEDGAEHQESIDLTGLPDPESLPTVWEKYGHLADNGRASWVLNRPFDMRYVDSDIVLSVEKRTSAQRLWLRARDTLPDTALLHSAALAFASDYVLMEPVLRRHGVPWATPGLSTASLDHAMWFHRPFRADEWLLYELDSPTSQGGRGLAHGRFYNRDGALVASVAQESMIRLPNSTD